MQATLLLQLMVDIIHLQDSARPLLVGLERGEGDGTTLSNLSNSVIGLAGTTETLKSVLPAWGQNSNADAHLRSYNADNARPS